MRFIFKTSYEQDLKILKHSGYYWSYGVLLAFLILAPLPIWPNFAAGGFVPLLKGYYETTLTFVFIYAIVGVALMILTGYTGQGSLGHAAFLAIGAYTGAYCQKHGIPFLVYFPLAGIITGAVGALVGFPALRLTGIYLVIATIAFAFIVEEIAARWETVTNGNEGIQIKALELFGYKLPRDSDEFYFLCLAVLVGVVIVTLNVLRSPTGRAFMAIRDSETAAKSMGVNLAATKIKAFTLSATITGLAGVLFAHKLSFISPEMFTLLLSLEFIIIIIIGGIIGLHGAILGAMFLVMIDPFLTLLKDDVPPLAGNIAKLIGYSDGGAKALVNSFEAVGSAPGLKGAIYGLIIILFIVFEPYGLYGRWLKVKLYFQLFPLYKKATFKRQKTYVKSERNR